MKRYVASDGQGQSIITVVAIDEQEAVEMAAECKRKERREQRRRAYERRTARRREGDGGRLNEAPIEAP